MTVVIKNVDSEVLRILLDLADNPRRDVVTTTQYSSLAVVVPEYLAERLDRYQALGSSSPKEPKKGSKK